MTQAEEKHLKQERDRWRDKPRRKNTEEIKLRRTKWRKQQEECRKRKKSTEIMILNTPPQSPEGQHRHIFKMRVELMKEKKLKEKHKKACVLNEKRGEDTPKSKKENLLSGLKVSSHVRKTLVFHHALLNDLKTSTHQ